MIQDPTWRKVLSILALAAGIVAVAGCATWQGPRIDPTGESLIVWPGEPTPVAAAPPIVAPAPVPGAPIAVPGAPTTIVAAPPGAVAVPTAPVAAVQPLAPMVPSTPFGNVMAPPVYSDPPGAVPTTPLVGPAPGVPNAAPTLPAPPAIGPPIAAAPAATVPLPPPPGIAPVLPRAPLAAPGRPFLCASPIGLVAPVGAEMVVKASVVTPNRQAVAGERIDWSIARDGVGLFTDRDLRNGWAMFWGLYDGPQLIDNWSATTIAATTPATLNAESPDPNDDIPIYNGESWVTLTSPIEGTSVITAFAPAYAEFNQATSTIYWVDAQWVIAPPAVVEMGRPHTLTTTVMRKTDGTPLVGWLVKYEVSAGAGIGYEGGNAVEATTDGAGRASVEISPKDVGGGTTNVRVTVIRPQNVGPAVMPRLQLGGGVTTITWAPAAVPAAPAPIVPSAPGSPTTIGPPPTTPPTLPTQPVAPPPSQPPAQLQPPVATGKPRLEAVMRPLSSEQISVGEYASFELTVTNRGDGIAKNIRIEDHFDRGLRHPNAKPGEYAIVYSAMRDLQPNESQAVTLTFQVVDGEMQCHEAVVTADGADKVTQKGCVTARRAVLEVTVNVPRRATAGEVVDFNAVVKNVGDVPATNIEVVVQCDQAIEPTMAERGHQQLANNSILLKIDRLLAGEKRVFGMQGRGRTASNKACVRATVTADGGVNTVDEKCFEILPPMTPGQAPPVGGTPAAAGLQLSISTSKNPARVNEKQLIAITVANAGQQAEQSVATRAFIPIEFTIDPTQIQPQGQVQVLGNEVRFTPLDELPAGQQKQYLIPVTPNRVGRVQVHGEITSTNLKPPKTVDSDPIDIVGAAP